MKIYTRTCPKCKKEILHKNKVSWTKSIKDNRLCNKCSKKISANTIEAKKIRSENSKKLIGDKNPFYGKKHSDYTKNKIKKSIGLKSAGENNPMYGKSFYDIWIKKYGKEEADLRLISFKKKISKSSSGKNNPMYGKPSPIGSGNGWSGWYKGYFFRSLKELSFIVLYVERFNLKCVTLENKKFSIPYINYNDSIKNYYADFLINDKYIIEIKPKKLWNSKLVTLKKEAAIHYCKNNNLIYKLIDPILITNEEILKLYKIGYLKWIDRYDKIFKTKYLNNE